MRSRNSMLALCAALTLACAQTAHAQGFPAKSVRFVVPGPPAGGTDYLTRLLAEQLSMLWRQSVVVENIAGASGIIGSKAVMSSAPDGYVIMMGHIASHAIVPAMHTPQPYDVLRDFTAISMVATAPELLVVASQSPSKTVAALIAQAKAKPNEVTYGSPGIGLTQHLMGFMLAKTAGVSMLHVPYKGSAPALTDLMGGRIAMMFVTPGAVPGHIKDGRLTPVAITSPKRSPRLPEVPTFTELGMANLEQVSWFGVFGPAKIPPQVTARISEDLAKVLAMPEIRAKIDAQFSDPVGTTPEAFAAFLGKEVPKWAEIVKSSGVRAD